MTEDRKTNQLFLLKIKTASCLNESNWVFQLLKAIVVTGEDNVEKDWETCLNIEGVGRLWEVSHRCCYHRCRFCVICDDGVFCLSFKGLTNVVTEVVVCEDVFVLINSGIFCSSGDGTMIVVRTEGWVLPTDVVWVWVDCNCVVEYIMFLEEVGNCFSVVKIVLDAFVEGVVDTKRVSLNAVVCFSMVVAIFVESCWCSVMLGDVDEEVEDILSEGVLDLLLVIEV